LGRSRTPATFGSVHDLAVELGLDEVGYRRAVALGGLEPGRRDWLRYLDRFLTAVGAALIVAGITAFFAWNWDGLHHLAKLALMPWASSPGSARPPVAQRGCRGAGSRG
jgi:hypothetical protein